MSEIKVGKFDVTIWKGGYPVWVEITYRGETIKIHHSEISDLSYALQVARQEARKELPERYRDEVL